MNVLVINSGSSSIKFSMYQLDPGAQWSNVREVYDGELSGVGTSAPEFKFRDANKHDLSCSTKIEAASTEEAIRTVETAVGREGLPAVEAVGYRVVHPGPRLHGHQRITSDVLQAMRDAAQIAPLHDPVAVEIIEQMMKRLPNVPHFACFDTVFHETMPEPATTYAIPKVYRDAGVRRYGFHGLSCESVLMQLREAGREISSRMVIAHLGSGCSVTALVEGKSVDTTMGLTPTGGVLMGTRPGDLDPGLMIYLLRQMNGNQDQAAELEALVNHKAGMVALTELANDMKAVRKAASDGNKAALLAIGIFTRSIRKAIGGFTFLMGGLDGIVLTGGIGEHDAATRQETLEGLQELGIDLDTEANGKPADSVALVSAAISRTSVYVVPAAEDRTIAWHVGQLAL